MCDYCTLLSRQRKCDMKNRFSGNKEVDQAMTPNDSFVGAHTDTDTHTLIG